MAKVNPPRIGISGWSLPGEHRHKFTGDGSHLERYARIFNCVEINSSFYREHRAETYRRWAASVPEDFRFSLKLNKAFTHSGRLITTGLEKVIAGHAELGEKWGVLLVQLPGKLEFHAQKAGKFFGELRRLFGGEIFCEPRNTGWASEEAIALLTEFDIGKVIADPERCVWPEDAQAIHDAAGATAGRYLRMHGSPVIYRSLYSHEAIAEIKAKLQASEGTPWCIFDNTMFGHAFHNAFDLKGNLIPAPGAATHQNSRRRKNPEPGPET